jgi:hypothetical protein
MFNKLASNSFAIGNYDRVTTNTANSGSQGRLHGQMSNLLTQLIMAAWAGYVGRLHWQTSSLLDYMSMVLIISEISFFQLKMFCPIFQFSLFIRILLAWRKYIV